MWPKWKKYIGNEVFFRARAVSMLICHLTLQSSNPGIFKDNNIIEPNEQKVLPQNLSPQPLTGPDLNTASQPGSEEIKWEIKNIKAN